MREIKVYTFNELNIEAQRVAASKSLDAISVAATEYLNEIYREYVEDLVEILAPGSEVIFSVTTTSINVVLRKLGVEHFNVADVKTELYNKLSQLKKANNWFTEDFARVVAKYNVGTPYMAVVQSFISKIASEAYEWLLRISTDVDYVIRYATEQERCKWCVSDYFFSKYNYLEDGRHIMI